MKRLTVIMPVYNEEGTVRAAIERVLAIKVRGVTLSLLVVDDGSSDGTMKEIVAVRDKRIKLLTHKTNRGKGAAIRTALAADLGDVCVIQDADLEYDPADLPLLLSPILAGKADVVFGSRFVGSQPHRVLYFGHCLANQIITFMADCLTNLNLTDIETGYKAFTKEVAQNLALEEEQFGFDPEFTIKVSKKGFRIYEVGISYFGRSYEEGKKITWRDGVVIIWTMLKYALTK